MIFMRGEEQLKNWSSSFSLLLRVLVLTTDIYLVKINDSERIFLHNSRIKITFLAILSGVNILKEKLQCESREEKKRTMQACQNY